MSNHDFWVAKIHRNKERDKEEQKKLASMGWHCITIWECELKPAKKKIRQYQWQQKIVLFRSVLMLHDG